MRPVPVVALADPLVVAAGKFLPGGLGALRLLALHRSEQALEIRGGVTA